MSGHSKWSKIKNQKATADIKRGKAFSLLARSITQAVKEGKSGDPNDNPRLRMILEKARDINLPKENVQRAVDRGLGKGSSGAMTEVVIEGYGPAGVGIMVIAVTDNPNRTKSEIKSIFETHEGSTGEPGSVAYVFVGNDGAPSYTILLSPQDELKIRLLLDALDEQEDVQDVKHNAQIQ
ncbi:YebC/PmpR family DNA-binding transcriptional regulator [Candidatus Collierbacteria bacterium]|nr:YebC/PmpR family DNA-binding transcriptional regulator [Candidatus Collierbacteria bacterium]